MRVIIYVVMLAMLWGCKAQRQMQKVKAELHSSKAEAYNTIAELAKKDSTAAVTYQSVSAEQTAFLDAEEITVIENKPDGTIVTKVVKKPKLTTSTRQDNGKVDVSVTTRESTTRDSTNSTVLHVEQYAHHEQQDKLVKKPVTFYWLVIAVLAVLVVRIPPLFKIVSNIIKKL